MYSDVTGRDTPLLPCSPVARLARPLRWVVRNCRLECVKIGRAPTEQRAACCGR
jgi:hypothetical protein